MAPIVPVLLRPKVLSLKNRWRTNIDLKGILKRDLILLFSASTVMYGIYYGVFVAVTHLEEKLGFLYIHPSMVFGLISIFLFSLLLLSSCINALAGLFLGSDLDLIMSSPISTVRFYLSKLIEITAGSGWMMCIFGLPILVAMGVYYEANWFAYLIHCALVLVPFFIIPSSFAMIAVTLFTTLIPVNRTKEALMVAGVALIVMAYYLGSLVAPPASAGWGGIQDFITLLNIVFIPHGNWSPSYWIATCLGELLVPTGKNLTPYIALLYSISGILVAVSFLLIQLLHHKAYSLAQGSKNPKRIRSRERQRFLEKLASHLNRAQRAIFIKELNTFSRDMGQLIQLILLLSVCSVYLYSFRIFRLVQSFPSDANASWQALLILGNIAMGAFVISATCTRFAFPSISLEGKAYWILRSSAVPLETLVRAKFLIWVFPIAIIGMILFGAGSIAVGAEPEVILLSILTAIALTYGLVGLAVGVGATFADFDIEHPSQMATGVAGLIYILASMLLILVTLLPASALVLIHALGIITLPLPGFGLYTASLLALIALLVLVNVVATRVSLRIGEQSLRTREC